MNASQPARALSIKAPLIRLVLTYTAVKMAPSLHWPGSGIAIPSRSGVLIIKVMRGDAVVVIGQSGRIRCHDDPRRFTIIRKSRELQLNHSSKMFTISNFTFSKAFQISHALIYVRKCPTVQLKHTASNQLPHLYPFTFPHASDSLSFPRHQPLQDRADQPPLLISPPRLR